MINTETYNSIERENRSKKIKWTVAIAVFLFFLDYIFIFYSQNFSVELSVAIYVSLFVGGAVIFLMWAKNADDTILEKSKKLLLSFVIIAPFLGSAFLGHKKYEDFQLTKNKATTYGTILKIYSRSHIKGGIDYFAVVSANFNDGNEWRSYRMRSQWQYGVGDSVVINYSFEEPKISRIIGKKLNEHPNNFDTIHFKSRTSE